MVLTSFQVVPSAYSYEQSVPAPSRLDSRGEVHSSRTMSLSSGGQVGSRQKVRVVYATRMLRGRSDKRP